MSKSDFFMKGLKSDMNLSRIGRAFTMTIFLRRTGSASCETKAKQKSNRSRNRSDARPKFFLLPERNRGISWPPECWRASNGLKWCLACRWPRRDRAECLWWSTPTESACRPVCTVRTSRTCREPRPLFANRKSSSLLWSCVSGSSRICLENELN